MLLKNTLVSYDNGFVVEMAEGGTSAGMTYTGYEWCYPYVERWYPVCYPYWTKEPNKIEQAFKIVQKLMEKKIIQRLTLKKFIRLVNEIAKDVL